MCFQSSPSTPLNIPFSQIRTRLSHRRASSSDHHFTQLFPTGSPRHRAQIVPEGHDLPPSCPTKPPPSLICLRLDDYLCSYVTDEGKRAPPARRAAGVMLQIGALCLALLTSHLAFSSFVTDVKFYDATSNQCQSERPRPAQEACDTTRKGRARASSAQQRFQHGRFASASVAR